jgi:hypothetical protein
VQRQPPDDEPPFFPGWDQWGSPTKPVPPDPHVDAPPAPTDPYRTPIPDPEEALPAAEEAEEGAELGEGAAELMEGLEAADVLELLPLLLL